MRPVFSEAGLQRLHEVARGGLLCAFDFDGTLAPLVPVPDDAHLPDDIRERLLRLGQSAPLAIITGRGMDDIRPRLGFTPEFLVGNHGLEGVPGWESLTAAHAEACQAWLSQLRAALPGHDPGILLEDKRYSLSLHYREAADPPAAARALEALFATLTPAPRVVAGKFVYNLLAEDRCHKGSALLRLMECCGARKAIYVGDDVTDEDVFRMGHPDILSIRIEASASSSAELYLPDFCETARLLDVLGERLRQQGARNWLRAAP
ncbi:trehalose-phosphatase [Noviherbaspirillum aridicola]|uniref:Trehalose 6-phosphate phosphatase n=1 Tax=Noviherbaspirillum aridicola TaxID=2849687 RepID=A0ABQ4Q3R5_9BURK|nr:trehalose-phosphatase [Noviherbaspirillum aridicola]GIZ51656.1 trehalose 6-phosphate phosphatase [Noviherbaspirillum aridicola]